MKKEDIYLDLSKLTDEQIEKVFSVLPPPERKGDYDIKGSRTILRSKTTPGYWFVADVNHYRTEVTFEQFLDIVQPKTYPRVMEVSVDNENWFKRVVFMEKNNSFLSWWDAETLEDAEKEMDIECWKYAREIEEPLELTLSEIAEKYGVSEVKIKQ